MAFYSFTTAGSSIPSGPAGGDLTGTYPNPGVGKVKGITVSAVAPSAGQVLTATAATTADWEAPAGGAPSGAAGGDLGSTYPNPTVVATHLASALPLAQGGTANTSAQGAIDTLAGGTTSGNFLRGNGTHVVLNTIQSGDISAIAALLAGATFTGAIIPAVAALSDGANIATNAALGNVFTVTIAGSRTMNAPSNAAAGQCIRYHITQGSGGSHTLTWNAAFDFGTQGAPTLSTSAGKVDVIGFEYDAGLAAWCYLGSALGN